MSYSRVTTAKGQRLLGFDPSTHSDVYDQYRNKSILDNTPMTQTKYINNYEPVNSPIQYNIHGGGQYPRNYNQSPVPSYHYQPSYQNQYQNHYQNQYQNQHPHYTQRPPNTNIPISNQPIYDTHPNYSPNYSQNQRLAHHPQTSNNNQYTSLAIQTSGRSLEQDKTKPENYCKKIILGLLVALLLLAVLAAVFFYIQNNHLLWYSSQHDNSHSQERQGQVYQKQESEGTYNDEEQSKNQNEDNSNTAYQLPLPHQEQPQPQPLKPQPQPQPSRDSSFMFPPVTQNTANTDFMLPTSTTHFSMKMRHFSDN